MIIKMECTDCVHCASFDAGKDVTCMNPMLPAEQVGKYSPANWEYPADAIDCPGFKEGLPIEFLYADLTNAKDEFHSSSDGSFEMYARTLRNYAERKRKK